MAEQGNSYPAWAVCFMTVLQQCCESVPYTLLCGMVCWFLSKRCRRRLGTRGISVLLLTEALWVFPCFLRFGGEGKSKYSLLSALVSPQIVSTHNRNHTILCLSVGCLYVSVCWKDKCLWFMGVCLDMHSFHYSAVSKQKTGQTWKAGNRRENKTMTGEKKEECQGILTTGTEMISIINT